MSRFYSVTCRCGQWLLPSGASRGTDGLIHGVAWCEIDPLLSLANEGLGEVGQLEDVTSLQLAAHEESE